MRYTEFPLLPSVEHHAMSGMTWVIGRDNFVKKIGEEVRKDHYVMLMVTLSVHLC